MIGRAVLPPNVHPLDHAYLAVLEDAVGADGITEIVRAFLRELPTLKREIGEAAKDCDTRRLRAALHTLSGAASGIGLAACVAFSDTYRTHIDTGHAIDASRLDSDLAQVLLEGTAALASIIKPPV